MILKWVYGSSIVFKSKMSVEAYMSDGAILINCH
jgi:hypothetical protein